MDIHEILKGILSFIRQPEIASALATIVIAFLVKEKVLSEKDVSTAKKLYEQGLPATKITDVVKMTLPEVAKIMAESSPDASMNTNKKKIQRGIRAALRGWLRF